MIGEGEQWSSATRRNVFNDREFPFTYRDFRQIATIVHDDAGITLADVKAPLVYSRLVKRLRSLGVESFARYCALIVEGDSEERQQMIAALTTNVTRFFREPHHFEHLKTRLLPSLLDGVRKGGRLRLWSAGCSSGEEPYSIALSILSVMPDAAKFDVKVLATDINKNILDVARRGVYRESVIAPVSRQLRADWFVPMRNAEGEKSWRVGDTLRTLVAFRELNLISNWPMRQAYRAIFCRNVSIYFQDNVQARLWSRLASLLAPGGCLYIGHSERIGKTDPHLMLDGNTVYRIGHINDMDSEDSHG